MCCLGSEKAARFRDNVELAQREHMEHRKSWKCKSFANTARVYNLRASGYSVCGNKRANFSAMTGAILRKHKFAAQVEPVELDRLQQLGFELATNFDGGRHWASRRFEPCTVTWIATTNVKHSQGLQWEAPIQFWTSWQSQCQVGFQAKSAQLAGLITYYI